MKCDHCNLCCLISQGIGDCCECSSDGNCECNNVDKDHEGACEEIRKEDGRI